MRFQTKTTIIGWGDVPTDPNYHYTNEQVLDLIRTKLTGKGMMKELGKIESMTGESVREKLGIENRQYYVGDTYSSTELARIAAERAITVAERRDSSFSREKIELIVSGGSTPDDVYPSCAAKLQHLLGIPNAEGFDVSAACSSGAQALITASRAIALGEYQYALVAVGEKIGSWGCDHLDENSLLWGDGGGAVVLSASSTLLKSGVIDYVSRVDGSLSGTTRSRGIGAHPDHRTFPALNASMEGRGTEIFRWVIGPVAKLLQEFVAQNNLPITDRTFLLPHNGNLRMVQSVGKAIGIPPERVLNRIAERGNQSSASVFSTLAHYANNDYFRPGDVLIFATFGGGVIYNFVAYRW